MSDIIAHIVAASTSIETKAVEEFEIFAKSQADAVESMILKKKKISSKDACALSKAVRESAFPKSSQEALTAAILASMGGNDRRPFQDFTTMKHFIPHSRWKLLDEKPHLALEVVCQCLHELGLIIPSEPTSAEAAAIIGSIRGDVWDAKGQADLFVDVKKKLKDCYKRSKKEPPVFVETYPATPGELLSKYGPAICSIYKDDLPIKCPIDDAQLNHQRGLADMRYSPDKNPKGADENPHQLYAMFMKRLVANTASPLSRNPNEVDSLSNFIDFRAGGARSRAMTGLRHLEDKELGVALKARMQEPMAMDNCQPGQTAAAPQPPAPPQHAAPATQPSALAAPLAIEDAKGSSAPLPAAGQAAAQGPVAESPALAVHNKIAEALAAIKADKQNAKNAKQTMMKRPASAAQPTLPITKRNSKPASWMRRYPEGCSKCRNVPGCTPSCWKSREETPPLKRSNRDLLGGERGESWGLQGRVQGRVHGERRLPRMCAATQVCTVKNRGRA